MKKVLLVILVVFVVIQFIPVDRTNPESIPDNDFLWVEEVPDELGHIFKSACYDCHSVYSRYPWYARIAPVSWIVQHHINDGRDELNFSNWKEYSVKKRLHKLDECYELVGEGEMPLKLYQLAHEDAQLSSEQRELLTNWLLTRIKSY